MLPVGPPPFNFCSLPAEHVTEVLLYTCGSLSDWSCVIRACRTLAKYGVASAPVIHELQTLRGPKGLPVHISHSGMMHLHPDTILPWARAFSPRLHDCWGTARDWEAAADGLGAYIWLVDICLCSCEFDHHHQYAPNSSKFPGEIVSSAESCPHAEALWCGVAGKPYHFHDDDEDNHTLRFPIHARFGLTAGLRKCWDDILNYYQFRVFGISPSSWRVVLHADTRHAYSEDFDRMFSAGEWSHCIDLSLSRFEKDDASEIASVEFLEMEYYWACGKGSDLWQL